jgi:hypothetical protein
MKKTRIVAALAVIDSFLKYFADGIDRKKFAVLYAEQGSAAASVFARRPLQSPGNRSRPVGRCAKQDD